MYHFPLCPMYVKTDQVPNMKGQQAEFDLLAATCEPLVSLGSIHAVAMSELKGCLDDWVQGQFDIV